MGMSEDNKMQAAATPTTEGVEAQRARVDGMIGRIERYQQALRLPDVRFAARFARHLGSASSWRKRLCGRKWAEIPLDRWERKLARFVCEIEGASAVAGSTYLAAMPIAQFGAAAYDALQGQMSDRRVAWLIGPTGVGKSWTMNRLRSENPHDTAYIHVAQGSRSSMAILARQLARACGAAEVASAARTFEGVIEICREREITLLIDDVHEGGALLLKLLKHLVDDSRVRLLLGTYPTAWAALLNGSSDALIEAQQLIGRSLKPICANWVEGLRAADVEAYLAAACPAAAAEQCALSAGRLAPLLRRNGNLRVLADAVELAQAHADEAGGVVLPELVETAARTLCA
jgi:hypothetical protein